MFFFPIFYPFSLMGILIPILLFVVLPALLRRSVRKRHRQQQTDVPRPSNQDAIEVPYEVLPEEDEEKGNDHG